MMNSKGFGRKQSKPNLVTTLHLPGETEEIYEKPQSE
jgi:hypothetical protein